MKNIKLLVLGLLLCTFMGIHAVSALADDSIEVDTNLPIISNVRSEVECYYTELYWDDVSNADYYNVYRADSADGEYKLVSSSYFNHYYDYDTIPGISYYYKIEYVVYCFDPYTYDDIYTKSPAYTYGPVTFNLDNPNITSITAGNSKSLTINFNGVSYADGYYIYQATSEDGEYTLVKNKKVGSSSTYSVKFSNLKLGTTYYYKVCAYVKNNDVIYPNSYSKVMSGSPTIDSTTFGKFKSSKPGTNTITWNKSKDADSYTLYVSKKINGKYKKLTTTKKLKYTHKKLTNGVCYYYKLVANKTINGKKFNSSAVIAAKYCDYYGYEAESFDSRMKRIFGTTKYSAFGYKSQSIAQKHMKSVKIKVWDSTGGKKFTRTFSVTVNKGIAPTVKKMFSEIYKSKEKFPIHDIGCFSWRGDTSTSEHNLGLAFDINANENYMIDGKKIQAGSFWKPKKNKYSIPLKCDLVKILQKYGFYRGFWGYRKDYMHFSYFGG